MDYFFFKNGKKFFCNGYIGIAEDGDGEVEIAHGYDGSILLESENGCYLKEEDYSPAEMSQEEKVELADHMISLWNKFKSVKNKPTEYPIDFEKESAH